MEKGEPALVPEWLRSSGGGSGHLFTSSSSHSDSSSTRGRITNSKGISSFLDRSSSDSRRSSNNGFSKNAYSSFSRNNNRGKDRDRDKERLNFSGDSWENETIEPLNALRRSHSMIAGKHDEFLSGKGITDSKNLSGNNHVNGSELEKEFPSLGSEEKQGCELVRVASPVLSNVAQSLPLGSSVLTGEVWASALVDVPSTISATASGFATGAPSPSSSALNMAEAWTQAPAKTRTSPQLSVQIQRREEIAIKQSRQLIPVTPTVSKISALSSKTLGRSNEATMSAKSTLQQPSMVSTPNLLSVKQEASKTSHGKLFVLKSGSANIQAASPLPSPNKQRALSGDRKPSALNLISGLSLEKKPSLYQTQSRNDFFNHLKKQTSNPSPALEQSSSVSSPSCELEKDAVQNNSDMNKKRNPSDDILKFSEEETAFLRSLGWEENSGEEELTEEEISSFYKEYKNRESRLKDCLVHAAASPF